MASRALTIHQPYAALVVGGIKTVENRSWYTSFRGRIYIHAGAKLDEQALQEYGERLNGNALVHAAILGTVEIVDCVRDYDSEWAWPGYWHWVLRDPERFARPMFDVRGRQSLWGVRSVLASDPAWRAVRRTRRSR